MIPTPDDIDNKHKDTEAERIAKVKARAKEAVVFALENNIKRRYGSGRSYYAVMNTVEDYMLCRQVLEEMKSELMERGWSYRKLTLSYPNYTIELDKI